MSDADRAGAVRESVPGTVARLTDGQWHRLHPASPLLRGGIALIAILGVVVSNLRERLFGLFLPRLDEEGDPVDYILSHGIVLQAGLVIVGVLLVLIAVFYLSWRMHSFRITDEVVEVRSGILFRTNRKARLDRIQGINIVRPLFARLFGAAKMEISQAGHDANVHLAYLGSAAADDLRREILRLASGSRKAAPTASAAGPDNLLDRRLGELLAPELDPDAAPPESVVKIHLGRLVGSILLSEATLIAIAIVSAGSIWIATTGQYYALFFALPSIIGFGSYYVRRFTRSLRYSIAGTPDGVRIGFGLLSTSNETLPPGRIHSVEVSQSILWRPAGWWQIRVNRASHSSSRGSANQANTTILPVGNLDDARRVLELMLPDLIGEQAVAVIEKGLVSRGNDVFTTSPRRAAWLLPLSWRRNGFLIVSGSLVLRKGAIWRRIVIVPQPRLQSVALSQGPVLRALGLADVHLHTVAGPIRATLEAIDKDAAVAFFGDVAKLAVLAGQSDTSHRWRSGEADTDAEAEAEAEAEA
jgi:putative membrane protein